MKLTEFKQIVQSEFGKHLENATPVNVREFLDRYQQQQFKQGNSGQPIEINEPAETYEEVIRDFFIRVLENPSEDAFVNLWILAFELSFAAEEDQYAERFAELFREA